MAPVGEQDLVSKTLRWHMPYIGEVPMSKYFFVMFSLTICHFAVFFIPECGREFLDLKEIIEENGGLVVE